MKQISKEGRTEQGTGQTTNAIRKQIGIWTLILSMLVGIVSPAEAQAAAWNTGDKHAAENISERIADNVLEKLPENISQNTSENTDRSRGYEIFLAEFLQQEPTIRYDLSRDMPHRVVVNVLREEDGADFRDAIDQLKTRFLDLDFQIDGMQGIYEEILLEIIGKQIQSNAQMELLQEKNDAVRAELFSLFEYMANWAPELLASDQGMEELVKSLEGFDQEKHEFQKLIAQKENLEIGVSALSVLTSSADNWIEYINMVSFYETLNNYTSSTKSFLEIVMRNTTNEDLRLAAYHIIQALEGIDANSMAKLVVQARKKLYRGVLANVADEIITNLLGAVGLEIKTVSYVMDLNFAPEDMAEITLLLQFYLDVEDEIRSAVSYQWNRTKGTYENAVIFNQGIAILYDCYEYGNDLLQEYADTVLGKGVWNEMKSLLNWNASEKETFAAAAKTAQGIIDAGRSVMDTAWEVYRELIQEELILLNDPPIVVESIAFEESVLYCDMSESGLRTCYAKSYPEETDRPRIYYSTTNPEVVLVDKESGILTLLQSGTASVVATTESGNFTATQQIIVTGKDAEENREPEASTWIPWREPTKRELSGYQDSWERNEDGITYYPSNDEIDGFSIIYIPSEMDGYPVTEVSFREGHYKCKAIVFAPSVKRVTNEEDGGVVTCERIQLNEGLEIIGDWAFHDLNVQEIYIPSTVTEIGEYAFADTQISCFVWPEWIFEIPAHCFEDCVLLETVVLPDQLKKIGESAFGNCHSLKKIKLPDSVREIGESAFADCSKLVSVELPAQLQAVCSGVFARCGTLQEVICKEGLLTIGDEAFFGCESLECVTFPSTLQSIGNDAFALCSSLEKIELPNIVGTIGEGAFRQCADLISVTCFDSSAPVSDLREGVGDHAFMNTPQLTWVELPAAITKLGSEVIGSAVIVLYLPDTLQYMDQWAMGSADGVQYIYTKPGIEWDRSIESETPIEMRFEMMESLKIAEIPAIVCDKLNLSNFPAQIEAIIGTAPITSYGYSSYYSDGEYIGFLEASEREMAEYEALRSIGYYDENNSYISVCEKNSYRKESLASYEKAEDYTVAVDTEETNITKQTIPYEPYARQIRVNAAEETADKLEGKTIEMIGWMESEGENRYEELGDFLLFEDLYLRQDHYMYVNISVELEDGSSLTSLPGEYQIIMEYPKDWTGEMAMYHIAPDGIITRLSGKVYNTSDGGREFRAVSSDLGNFALIHITKIAEVVPYLWENELYQLRKGDVDGADSGTVSDEEWLLTLEEKGSNQPAQDYDVPGVPGASATVILPSEDTPEKTSGEASLSEASQNSPVYVLPIPLERHSGIKEAADLEESQTPIFRIQTEQDSQEIEIWLRGMDDFPRLTIYEVIQKDGSVKYKKVDTLRAKTATVQTSSQDADSGNETEVEQTIGIYQTKLKDTGTYLIVIQDSSHSTLLHTIGNVFRTLLKLTACLILGILLFFLLLAFAPKKRARKK